MGRCYVGGASPRGALLLPVPLVQCGWSGSGRLGHVLWVTRGAQTNPAFIFKIQTDGIKFTNVGLKEMRKVTKDLAKGRSQEMEEGP